MLLQLYPQSDASIALQGCYLDLKLHQQATSGDIFMYANYISSVDGRISLLDGKTGEFGVPSSIGNGRDWRLYQELAGQSDVMITSARYFRQLAKGQAQDLLPVGSGEAFADIKQWREQEGMKAQPDVVIISESLDIPIVALQSLEKRKIIVFTTKNANVDKIVSLKEHGVAVFQAAEKVTGAFIRQTLIALDYRSAYMIAGPQVHHTLLIASCLDALFLTSHMSLLGCSPFHTVLEHEMKAVKLDLKSLYLDQQEGQMFMRYQCLKPRS